METAEINQIKNLLPWFIKHGKIWTDYDQAADVLYVHFKKPNLADNSEMTDDDVIVRYEKDEIIGITLLNASKKG